MSWKGSVYGDKARNWLHQIRQNQVTAGELLKPMEARTETPKQNKMQPAFRRVLGVQLGKLYLITRADRSTSFNIAIYASLYANFALCVIQRGPCPASGLQAFRANETRVKQYAVYAAISFASLSLLATAIDAVLDIGVNVLLFWLNRKAVRLDTNGWPVGGARLETIGNVVCRMSP